MNVQIRAPLILLGLGLFFLAGCQSITLVEIPKASKVSKTSKVSKVSETSKTAESVVTNVEDEPAPRPKPPPKPSDYPVAPFKDDSLYHLLVAEVAGYRSDYDTALEKYMEMAELTRDPGVAARATRLANFLKRNDLALKAARIWAEVEPDNIDAHRHAADHLMRIGDLEGAMSHMEAVFAYRAGNLDEQARDSLLVAISNLLERHPNDDQLMFSKAVLLEQKGDLEASLLLVEKLLEEKKNTNVVILKVNVLKNMHRSDDAIDFLKGIVENNNRRLLVIYARFLFEAGRLDDAREQYEHVLKMDSSDGDILFALALIAMEQKNDLVAAGHLEQMIRYKRRAGEAHFYLGTLAEKNGDIPAAIRNYRQVGHGYEFLPAHSRIANLMAQDGRIDEMRSYLAQLRRGNPERAAQLVVVEAQILSERGLSEQVFSLLDKVLADDTENVDLLYFRAMTGQKFGHMDILENDLQAIIRMDPNNSDALNALGYTLADQTDRHSEAHDLIKRALAIKPEEAAFIDSMGWVLYRLQNYAEAVTYLRRALELFVNDEVAAHLGEVLWIMGETAEAVKIWQKALELAPDSEILKKVIERFTLK